MKKRSLVVLVVGVCLGLTILLSATVLDMRRNEGDEGFAFFILENPWMATQTSSDTVGE